jgi:glucuronate isomerase
MKRFIDDNFLLTTATSERLYHGYAKEMPIIDYHCHLPPDQIAADHKFKTLTEAWLYGDHYKWRAMRTNGVEESYCTGNRNDWEKFEQWAATVPYTLRNPLYHWTHLELRRYFGLEEILNSDSARKVYDTCTEKLQSKEYSIRNLLRRMNVKVVCTTDDPIDSLEHHQKLQDDRFEIRVLPAFRPDKAMNVDSATAFNAYVNKLQGVSNTDIISFSDYLDALKGRHDYFASMGCSVSDHGLEQIYAEDYTESEINAAFKGRELEVQISHAGNLCCVGLGERLGTAISFGCTA